MERSKHLFFHFYNLKTPKKHGNNLNYKQQKHMETIQIYLINWAAIKLQCFLFNDLESIAITKQRWKRVYSDVICKEKYGIL